MRKMILLLLIALMTTAWSQRSISVDESGNSPKDPKSIFDTNHIEMNGTVLYDFNTVNVLVLGVVVVGDTVIVSSAGISSTVASDNMFYRYSLSGTLLDSVPQNTTTGWGYRDLAFDGQYIIAGHEGGYIYRLNRTTLQKVDSVLNAGQSSNQRGIAYVPGRNAYYVTNFTTNPLLLINASTGAVLRSVGTPTVAPYGIGFDNLNNPNSGALWYAEPSTTNMFKLSRVDTATGLINLTYDLTAQYGTGASSGGLEIMNNHPQYPGKVIAVMARQGTPNRKIIFVDITQAGPANPSNVTATYNEGLNRVELRWTNPTTSNNGQPIVVDSTTVFLNGNRLTGIAGADSAFNFPNPPGGIHVFGVKSWDLGLGSQIVNAPPVPVGIYFNEYSKRGWITIRDNSINYDTLYIGASEVNVVKVMIRLDTLIHTWAGDVVATIIKPNGDTLRFLNGRGSSGDNFIMTQFDDDAALPISGVTSSQAPFTGSWKPETPLAPLAGPGWAGSWILKILDRATGDTGHVAKWSVILVTDGQIPVELSSFAAKVSGRNVELNWTTATETNNSGFEIQRKVQGGEFAAIGFVEGLGNSLSAQNYRFVDKNAEPGSYIYRLKQIDYDGSFEYSNEIEVDLSTPTEFALSQNYPNPFNPSTKIDFALATDSRVVLEVYDAVGQLVTTLVNKELTAGSHQVNFDASAFNSGLYIYKLTATGKNGENYSSVRKMMLMK